ncbi:MAG: hypothetical protein ACLQBJ_02270 [Bryobacteraceae bacterium]
MAIGIIESVIALATCAAAIAAWQAAKAAKAQVKLLLPRPVVTVQGNWSLEAASGVGPDGFLLQNLGSSPAFDVRVSDIEGPLLQQVQYRERLTTDRIFVLADKKELEATHHRQTPGNVLDHQAVVQFVQNAGQAFSPKDGCGNTLEHKLKFFVDYSASDGGRGFQTECLICFSLGFPNPRARIAPASGWLGKEIPPDGGRNFLTLARRAIRGIYARRTHGDTVHGET